MTKIRAVIWNHYPQFFPKMAFNDDGRIKIWDDEGNCLIMPAPAADIWRDIEARQYARTEQSRDDDATLV